MRIKRIHGNVVAASLLRIELGGNTLECLSFLNGCCTLNCLNTLARYRSVAVCVDSALRGSYAAPLIADTLGAFSKRARAFGLPDRCLLCCIHCHNMPAKL